MAEGLPFTHVSDSCRKGTYLRLAHQDAGSCLAQSFLALTLAPEHRQRVFLPSPHFTWQEKWAFSVLCWAKSEVDATGHVSDIGPDFLKLFGILFIMNFWVYFI